MPAPRVQTGNYSSTDHNALAQYVDDTRTGVVGYGQRTSHKTGITAESPLLRVDSIPLVGGHQYKISASLRGSSTVATDTYTVRTRIDTTGAAATTASTVLGGLPGAQNNLQCYVFVTYSPVGAETLSVLLTLARAGGTGTFDGNIDGFMELVIEDMGYGPGDTGVDL